MRSGAITPEAGDEVEQAGQPRRTVVRRILLASVALLIVAAALLWWQRLEIAQGLLDRELARRGVAARFRVTEIGVATQRIEALVIGDPASPDLTARSAEVLVAMGFRGPRITGVRAEGVRLRGRWQDGRLRLGAVDRLLPPPSGRPFALPDFFADLRDARLDVATPWGPVRARIDGRGNLADGFDGSLQLVSPALAFGGCEVRRVVAGLAVATVDGRPSFRGPVRTPALACGDGVAVDSAVVRVDAALAEAFDGWQGTADVDLGSVRGLPATFAGVRGRVGFAGTPAGTGGAVALEAARARGPGLDARGLQVAADYRIADGTQLVGELAIERASLGERWTALPAGAARLDGTPLGPLAVAIGRATRAAATAFSGRTEFALTTGDDGGTLRLDQLSAESESGARLALSGGDGVTVGWPDGGSRLDGRLTLSGGGFPQLAAELSQPRAGAPISGTARMAPFAAGDARLALEPVRFTTGRGGTRIATRVLLDGPLAGGRIEGLTLPLALSLPPRGAPRLDPGCLPVAFRTLRLGGTVLDPTRLTLCPEGRSSLLDARGIAALAARDVALSGRIGTAPLTLTAAIARIAPGVRGFALADAAMTLGDARVTEVAATAIEGRIEGGALAGRYDGGRATIGGVPLVVSEASGDWRYAGGALDLAGPIQLTDAFAPARFEPLAADDMRFTLADERIEAGGTLRHPATGTEVTRVAIVHRLGPGTGEARLDVPGIRFGEALQPERLTRLTLGVIANVDALVTGSGRIAWSPAGVTSEGSFATEGADFAAAFGPVEGLSTRVRFDDLLALRTGPGQVATIRSVNPGIEVRDGALRYQLLPERRVRIEGGSWPLAGGTLTFEPTLLDFSESAQRRMTFTVVGLDASQFIGRFGFDDLAATGTFDGQLPILFDRQGGRIVGGALVSREGGGTLAYNGELSDQQLGTWGKLAFDALRSIRYNRLAIGLDGALDGEMVTEVRFSGVNRATPQTRASLILSQFTNLPFIFNIRIQAPFRGLLATLRGFGDPEELIRERLPEAREAAKGVQTPASTTGS